MIKPHLFDRTERRVAILGGNGAMYQHRINHRLGRNGAPKPQQGDGPEHLIELRNVMKIYQSAAGPFTALNNINLQVDSGEFVAVMGKSGSGKSTLINMITGIDRPTSGEVYIGGKAIHLLSEEAMAIWRGKNVGIIFQFYQLLPTLTCLENVMLPMDFCSVYKAREWRGKAMQLLEQVDIVEHAHKLPTQISGGQQQRVAIARALATDPSIIVADEPTGNLDSVTAEAVFALFKQLIEQGKTILMVTHDADLAQRATRTLIISDGELIEEDLSQTFPALNEAQLVWITRALDRQRFAPGSTIIAEGRPPEFFYFITKGRVEVLLHGGGEQEIVAATMGAGQYFGEIELVRGGNSIATVRAHPEIGAEVAALDRASFQRLLGESAPIEAEINRIVQERTAENMASREQIAGGNSRVRSHAG